MPDRRGVDAAIERLDHDELEALALRASREQVKPGPYGWRKILLAIEKEALARLKPE